MAPEITAPADDTNTDEASVHVAGIAEPNMSVTILRNGVGVGAAIAAADGSYQMEVPLVKGYNTLVSRSVNDCGTTRDSAGISVFRIVADEPGPVSEPATAPTVPEIIVAAPTRIIPPSHVETTNPTEQVTISKPLITRPKSNSTTANPRLFVTGNATPGTVIAVIVNGQAVAQVITGEDGSFGAMVALRLGDNSIYVISTLGDLSVSSAVAVITYKSSVQETGKKPEQGDARRIVLTAVVIATALGVSLYGVVAFEYLLKPQIGKRFRKK